MATESQKKARNKWNEAHYVKKTWDLEKTFDADTIRWGQKHGGLTQKQAVIAMCCSVMYRKPRGFWQKLKDLFNPAV